MYVFLDIVVSLFYEVLLLENNGIWDIYKEILGYCLIMLFFCLRKNEIGLLVNREVVKSEVNLCFCIFLLNCELLLSLLNIIISIDYIMGYFDCRINGVC